MPSQEKVESIEALKAKLEGVTSAVLTEYRGLTVQQLSDLRRQLRAVSAEYKVVKNRLAKLAIRGSHLDSLEPHLQGPIGLALGRQDPMALAKALSAFVRSNPKLQIKVGYVEGQLVQPPEIRALGDIPSREVLLVQVVGGLTAPLAALIYTLDGMLRSLVSVLDQVRAKRGGATESGGSSG
ncbi:MAG: 50S ribosomal protein L10 [Candidatus Methylomirabilia bacterium]